jgi:hypothetical protein
LNQTRWDLNSDYSDRLLGHANTAMAPGTSDITLRPDMMLKKPNRRA